MIVFTEKEIYSTEGLYINRIGTSVYFKRANRLPSDLEGMFREVSSIPVSELDAAKENKINEIDNYYNSSNVNNFKLNGMDMWLDPTLRGNVQRQIWAANVKGDETLTISISGIELTLPIATAELLLAELEQYAATCYNVRDKKYAEVKNLEDIEQVTAYDATSGYPEQLNLATTT